MHRDFVFAVDASKCIYYKEFVEANSGQRCKKKEMCPEEQRASDALICGKNNILAY